MFKSLHKSEEISLSIKVSPDFTGILRGFAHDISEGCTLNGELIMAIAHRVKIKSVETVFTGICRVNFKTTNKMGVPTSDGTESRGIYRKKITHLDDIAGSNSQNNSAKKLIFEAGTYKFPFSFRIPPSLPHTFNGQHGSIEYELSGFVTRSIFSTNVHVSKPVTIRRCLMNTPNPIAQTSQTVQGEKHSDIVKYSATAPSMVYCEGGLLELGLNIELKDPDRYSLRIVTCGLKEKVLYRTTGRSSLTNQAMHYSESSFPLGCSSFFPSQHSEYNPTDLHHYNAIFRLYPRVHSDNKSILIVVKHLLMIRIIIDDNQARNKIRRQKTTDTVSSIASASGSVGERSILSHLSFNQHDRPSLERASTTMSAINMMPNVISGSNTPLFSRSPSASESLGETSSSESISPSSSSSGSSSEIDPFPSNLVRVSSRKLDRINPQDNSNCVLQDEDGEEGGETSRDINRHRHHSGHSLIMHHHFNPFQFHKSVLDEGTYECILHMPIIVTSREEYREGGVPALPDYETAADEPPSYRAALQCLPPVPLYPSAEELESSDNNDMFNS